MRLTTVFASALIAAASLSPLEAPGQIVGTPNLGATPLAGVPIAQTPFFQGVPANATIPSIVPELCVPRPLQENVNPNLREIRITFNQPMDVALFYWPLPVNDPAFPTVTNTPFWTNNNQTLVIPVILSASRIYSIPINSPTLVFRGATGLYANPGLFRFETAGQGQGGSVSLGRAPTVPNLNRTPIPVNAPRVSGAGVAGQGVPATIGATPAAAQAGQSQSRMAPVRQSGIRQSQANPALPRQAATPTPRTGNIR